MKYIKLFEFFNKEDNFENINVEKIYDELVTSFDISIEDISDEEIFKYKQESVEIYNLFKELYELVEINIYRTIKSDNIEDIDLEDPGDYWSWERESAISFSERENRGNFLLSAKIKSEDVNWWKSIKAYIQFSLYQYPNESENEINVNSFEVYDINIEKIN